MDPVDVSIIIVTLNTCELLQHALNSIRDSEDTLRKEVIVVDNGTDEATAAMLAAQFPDVIYLPQPRNLGFAQANNRGARHAHGAFLCLLNSDARLKPDSLSRAVEFMQAHPQCGAAGVQLLNSDGSRQNSIANFPTLATELLNKSVLRRLFPDRYPGKDQTYPEPLEVESVIGAFLLTRHDLWNRLTGLDESYFFFLEETDYCQRVRQAGYTVHHLPQIEVWHDQGQTARQVPIPARIEYWRSRYTYFRNHHPLHYQWLLSSGLLLKLAGSWLANLLLGIFRPPLRTKSRLQAHLLLWHLRGCPTNQGLSALSAG